MDKIAKEEGCDSSSSNQRHGFGTESHLSEFFLGHKREKELPLRGSHSEVSIAFCDGTGRIGFFTYSRVGDEICTQPHSNDMSYV